MTCPDANWFRGQRARRAKSPGSFSCKSSPGGRGRFAHLDSHHWKIFGRQAGRTIEEWLPVSTYSWRQKVTTVLRKGRVPEDQISELLGHRRTNLRVTAGYGDWDPDYQREAAAALDAWFWRFRKGAKKLVAEQARSSPNTPGRISGSACKCR
jgi:integrase